MIAFLLFLLSLFSFLVFYHFPQRLGYQLEAAEKYFPCSLPPSFPAQACLRQSATKMQQREMPCFMGFLAFFMLIELVFEGFPPNSCRPHPDIEQLDVFFFCPVSGAFSTCKNTWELSYLGILFCLLTWQSRGAWRPWDTRTLCAQEAWLPCNKNTLASLKTPLTNPHQVLRKD